MRAWRIGTSDEGSKAAHRGTLPPIRLITNRTMLDTAKVDTAGLCSNYHTIRVEVVR